MKRSRLKKRANKSGTTNDREQYKKQRNKVIKLNREAKRKCYQSLDANSVDNDKKFWKTVKPMFSNGNPMTDKIILIERGEIISNDQMIAECFNDHFVNITDSLGLDPTFRDDFECQDLQIKIDRATEKYKEHASIIAIKNRKCTSTFSFEHVNPWNVMD